MPPIGFCAPKTPTPAPTPRSKRSLRAPCPRKLVGDNHTMESHMIPSFHTHDAILAVAIAIAGIVLSSLIKEPHRRTVMAFVLAGAGAAYLSGGGLGKWEFAGLAITYCAYKGLHSYRFIGLGWILHAVWDLVH